MIIDITRFEKTEKSTIGLLQIDGKLEAFTLEDPVREEKIPEVTAIPKGTYEVKLREEGGMIRRYQRKFGEIEHPGMLWLQEVPGFEWVYLHIGNNPKNTDGCILVASIYDVRQPDIIGASTVAYRKVYKQILQAIELNEGVFINVYEI